MRKNRSFVGWFIRCAEIIIAKYGLVESELRSQQLLWSAVGWMHVELLRIAKGTVASRRPSFNPDRCYGDDLDIVSNGVVCLLPRLGPAAAVGCYGRGVAP